MTKFAPVAVIAMCLTGTAAMAAEVSERAPDGRIHMAQLNSPGDGLDGDAASQGNGRPNRAGAPTARQKPMTTTGKKRRVRR